MAVSLGCQQIHVPTSLIVQNLLKWLDLIDSHKATISWELNFAFFLICDRASEIKQKHWDLSSMRFVINAGEPMGINPDYLIPVAQEAITKTAIGKIQRSQMSQRFLAGEFKPILKRIDILLGNANTIPDWFYRQVWKPKYPMTFNSSLTNFGGLSPLSLQAARFVSGSVLQSCSSSPKGRR
jgi:hypothetical protein